MRTLRVYLDTSVIGGCCDREFAEDSRRVLEYVRTGRLTALLSSVVIAELQKAPADVVAVLTSLSPNSVEYVAITDEVVQLRDAYLSAGVLGVSSLGDATHVAGATVARADAILSWNFRHIVRLDKIKQYNQVNLANGYGILTILSPREVDIDDA